MLLISCHIFYTCHFLLGFMSANTLKADTGNNCMYPKVLSLYKTVISICNVPEGTITVRDSDLYLFIPEGIITVRDSDLYLFRPEGIITVRDSDLCHVLCSDPFGATVIQMGSMSSTQIGPRYLSMYLLHQLYLPYRHAYLSLYHVLSRQSTLLHFMYISHKHE